MDTIASRLKEALRLRELSQTKLAELAGVSQGTIGNISSGARDGLQNGHVQVMQPDTRCGLPPGALDHCSRHVRHLAHATRAAPLLTCSRPRSHPTDDCSACPSAQLDAHSPYLIHH